MGKTNLCGSVYELIGESSSDLILKTRGKIKIQWGNKYIDLIKDGKIISDNSVFYEEDSIDDISNEGIYLIGGDLIYLKIGSSEPIKLSGEDSNVYVSFLANLTTTSEQKYNALNNIGFIYNSLNDIDETSLQNGIIYVESSKKLYTISNGSVSQFNLDLPNPYTKQFTIKNESGLEGAIIINGYGTENGIFFNSAKIYNDYNLLNIKSNKINLISGDNDTLIINDNAVNVNGIIKCDYISSSSSTTSSGFKLYNVNNKGILEVDEIINRQEDELPIIHPEYYSETNTIKECSCITITNTEESYTALEITLNQEDKFMDDDTLIVYYGSESIDIIRKTINKDIIYISNSVIIDSSLADDLVGNTIYLKYRKDSSVIRQETNHLDIIDNNGIIARYGDLTGINTDTLNKSGIYSKLGFFDLIYSNSIPPIGSVITFYGDTVPEGWLICDGTNDTPNLSEAELTKYNLKYIMRIN